MSLATIEVLLCQSMGLKAESIGHEAVRAAIRRRLEVLHRPADELDGYAETLRQSRLELQALIDEVAVPETFFFRDGGPFEALAEHARAGWVRPGAPAVRLLSAPCATGEEPYSMAITLLEAGVPASRFHIDGIDIRQAGLRTARDAVYGQYSIRGQAVTSRHLERTDDGQIRVGAEARGSVRFRHANLLDPGFLADQIHYDVVFCRNLLIYFDDAARQTALAQLRRLVRPGGLLFVGAAEALICSGKGFRLQGRMGAFSLRREDEAPTRPVTLPPPARASLAPAPAAAPAPAPRPPVRPPSRRPVSVKRLSPDLFAEAQRLADSGEVQQARVLLEKLVEVEPTADAYFLLGVLSQATHDGRAADHFSRAIYLDPAHVDALNHLALEKERAGDREAAQRLRERARRAGQGRRP